MNEVVDYQKVLLEAINSRGDWLEKSELSTLKEKFRAFHTAYSSFYSLLLKKGFIKEDPYKSELNIGQIEIPDAEPFPEADTVKQLSIRLANYDNQLDLLVNFHQFKIDFFTLDSIKRILELLKYIDWINLSIASKSPTTRAVADLVDRMRVSNEVLDIKVINGVIISLSRLTSFIMNSLKVITDFKREEYKCKVRETLKDKLPAGVTPSIAQIKQIYIDTMPKQPFYIELIDELLKEDYSAEGPALREKVLKSLEVTVEKAKTINHDALLRGMLLGGLQVLSSLSSTLHEIVKKMEENKTLLENQKLTFWVKVKQFWDTMWNKKQEPLIYEVEYVDEEERSGRSREKIDFYNLCNNIYKQAKHLSLYGNKAKLESLSDEQLVGMLDVSIKDMRKLHRTLAAIDEYFKVMLNDESKKKIQGIKPELMVLRNGFLKANQKHADYSIMKEEEEQFKRMGIDPVG